MLKLIGMERELHPLLQESLKIKSMKLGLERMEEIDRILGCPSKQFASVQIAGTNGKGSVTTKIARALQANGKRVGLYTSPHIQTYHERIQVNGKTIPEERADSILKKILASTEIRPSYFELLTLLAFCYFAEEKVDFAVLEAGMGGRLDATNIVNPVLSVITSIDLDHVQYLGDTLEGIAFEKAGIIKPGVPALIGPHVKPVGVFEAVASKVKSPLFQILGTFAHYEEENQAIALKALSLLPFPLEKKSIDCGLMAVPPCRFEIVSTNDPIVILDVAHNPDGLRRTFERLFHTFPGKKVRVLAAFSADKAIEHSLGVIREHAVEIHLTHTDHFRLLPIGDPLELAFERAYARAKKNQEILLVCGTFYIMHRARIASRLMREKGGG
jgi:dihydrofolate synthase / folylpolyglutamate synthase